MNGNRTLKVIVAALLGAGTATGPAAMAQEMPDFEQWQCRFCPFPEKGVSGSADASVLNVSDDSARFGDYTGLDEKGTYVNADADVTYRAGDGYAVSLYARDLGLDSRLIELSAGRQGPGSWISAGTRFPVGWTIPCARSTPASAATHWFCRQAGCAATSPAT
jgi:hypothetical protein